MKVARVLLAVGMVAGLAAGSAFAASPSYWKKDGSGNWSDASRWKDGNVPQAGWQVRFDGGAAAVANDCDMELLNSVKALVIVGNASLTINNEQAQTLTATVYGEGVLGKSGKGRLTIENDADSTRFNHTGSWRFTDGSVEIHSPVKFTTKIPVELCAPCKLVINASLPELIISGLTGDGEIVNERGPEANKHVVFFAGGTKANPYVFSGQLDASLRYQLNTGVQYFTNPDLNYAADVRCAALNGRMGFVSVTKEPVFTQSASLDYLGEGDTWASDGKIWLNNEMKRLEICGGPTGGLVMQGSVYTSVERMGVVVFSGDHGMPCAMDGSIQSKSGTAIYVKKDGTGTWRFLSTSGHNDRAGMGTVAVERGTLEYATIAERGTACSLGTATICHSEYSAARDDTKAVPYACLLGNGTNEIDAATATMTYVGTNAASITTRPVALNGAGRFATASNTLGWAGFTSARADDNTLILGGAAAGCEAWDVTNGVGRLSVAKDGPGDWTLRGALDVKGLYAREGTLRVGSSEGYTWYKVEITKVVGSANLTLRQLALWNDTGLVTDGVTYDKSKVSATPDLDPGEATLEFLPSSNDAQNNDLGKWFTTADADATAIAYTTIGAAYHTSISVVIRLPEGKSNATHCDFRLFGNLAGVADRYPVDWTISASRDGRHWTVVGEKTGQTYDPAVALSKAWVSDQTFEGTWTKASHAPGFELATYETSAPFAGGAPLVGAAENATLVADETCAAKGVVYDCNQKGGTISNFDFADADTLVVKNLPAGASALLPLTFENCTGLDDVGDWSVVVDGVPSAKKWVQLTPKGLVVNGGGTLLIVR